MTRVLTTIALSLLLLTGCATTAPSTPITTSTAIIDVRTPSEFAAGHLQGAVNIDVNSGNFDAAIATLPVDGDYFVYCASGHRAGIAITHMQALGFTKLVNGGGISDASTATGLPIVTG